MLSILNVGRGDTKISFDPSKPDELERAKRTVLDMLRRGYAILVQAGEKDGKPIFYRATDFDPKTCEYIIAGTPKETTQPTGGTDESEVRPLRRQPAGKAKAVAVARSAGGMSQAANSVEAENMRRFDSMAETREILSAFADRTSEWAGIPMPLDDAPLVVEPTYPRAKELMRFCDTAKDDAAKDDGDIKIRSKFYSQRMRCDVAIVERDGKIDHGLLPAVHSLASQLRTMGASDAWGIEQESAALQLLGTLIQHRQMKQYLLTGVFMERSRRSGVHYAFRRLRPTVAIRADAVTGETKILAALCMHPIAYYDGSWAGAMCPTDDVIAHLMLMRGDERLFWRRSNQHPAYRPEAGL